MAADDEVSTLKEILDAIGINGANAAAGFGGGLVSIFFNKTIKPFDAVGAIVTGTLAGNYLGPLAADTIHTPTGGTCFIVGFGGLQLVAQLAVFFRTKFPGGAAGGSGNA